MLSDEEKKARKKARAKAYYENNREKVKARNTAYRENNRETIKTYNKENSEKTKAYMIEYRKNNREKIQINAIAWIKANPEKHKKIHTIADWKKHGLICDDYDKLYSLYLQSTNCEECGCKYSMWGDGSGRFRCMDHDHLTGLFRNFLCSICNIRRR